MPRLLRQPEAVWLSAVVVTVIVGVNTSADVTTLAVQIVLATVATFLAFACLQTAAGRGRPAGLTRAFGWSTFGSFLVFVWLAIDEPSARTDRSSDVFYVGALTWFIQIVFAAHLSGLASTGWRPAIEGWRAAVERSPEVVWLTFTLLVVVLSPTGPELKGWSSVWLMAIVPMAVVFGCLVLLVRTPAALRTPGALARTLLSCFVGLMASTLAFTLSPTFGAYFLTGGSGVVWAVVLFWQWVITTVCGIFAWAVVREMMTPRTAVRVFVGGTAAVALGIAAWSRISELSRDPIELMSGEQRVRALSEAFGQARQQQPRSAWADGRETWNGFSVAFEPPDALVIRVATDYASALSARPPLAAGVTSPDTIADPEKTAAFWNTRATHFAILRPSGISSQTWRASWEPPQPDGPPTLVWTFRDDVMQFTRQEFVDLCAQAQLFHTGLLQIESGWGYWAEVVEVLLLDPKRLERHLTRDLRRAQISLLQLAADCGGPGATCGNEVSALLALAETARSFEAEEGPTKDAISARLTTPLYDLAQRDASFSPAQRRYLDLLRDAVYTSGVLDNHPKP